VVKAQLGTSPWYIQQLANSESPGYRQFLSSGYPVFGAPNGFGIMQIDYHNNVYDLWTWTVNVADGQSTIAANAANGLNFWVVQIKSSQAYDSSHPNPAAPLYSTIEGPCEFEAIPIPIRPPLQQHSYSDAIAIKSYNSGPPSIRNPINAYIRFNPAVGVWVLNPLGGTSPPFDYVYRVCTTIP